MIKFNGIFYSYPRSDFSLVIDDLLVYKNQKTALIGPSGFGKTTLLNLIAGILVPQEGQVNIDDTIVNQLSEKERRNFRIRQIGFVFQDFKLLEYLNVIDNILLPCRINKVLKGNKEIRNTGKRLAEELKIGDKIYKYPSKLSHGERQRVAICRALLNDPKIILADEPTGNLDPANKIRIMEILFGYVEKNNSTLITVTHDHELLKGFDHIIDFKDLNKN